MKRIVCRSVVLAMSVGMLALLVGPSAAAPESKIVIHGPSSESHLRLTVSGEDILVHGPMANADGCEVADRPSSVVCPYAAVGMIEVEMGPSQDKVEVLDPLPIPLTVHLGAGEDKFIGNDESDTCYSEETKRNRCIGGGGDDICITGQENSDCVGGPGDDLCVHGAGSDGCFGGPGDDVCEMGSGKDGCHGGPGDDKLYGGPDPDQLYGGSGHDLCDGGPGVGRSHGCESGPGD